MNVILFNLCYFNVLFFLPKTDADIDLSGGTGGG